MSVANRPMPRFLRPVLAVLVLAGPMLQTVEAGELDRQAIARYFPPPFEVAEQEATLPVWPLFLRNGPYLEPAGYAFESVDLAPLPGFAGVPINLLVGIDPEGRFIHAAVISQHEPVFLDGLGPEPMHAFMRQYAGLSLHQNIKVSTSIDSQRRGDSTNTYIDGVSKATASVRIMNDALLNAALKVARQRMGVGEGGANPPGRIRQDLAPVMDWAQLRDAGLVQSYRLDNRQLEQGFADGPGAGLDPIATAQPDAEFIEIHAAYLNLPSVRRTLYPGPSGAAILNALDPGDLALVLISRGRYSFTGEDFVPHSVPDRLALRQAGYPIGLRDMDRDERPDATALPAYDTVKVFRILAETGIDPARPLEISLRVTRLKGYIYPEEISRDFSFEYRPPAPYVEAGEAVADLSGWRLVWYERRFDLLVLLAAALLLTGVLLRPGRLAGSARRLARFRLAWLVFVLVFVGWYAQGQLSVVNLTAAVQAIKRDSNLAFMLHDPMTLSLWIFVLATLVLWGRGLFCGWLCPFGALQELLARAARRLGLRPRSLPANVDRRLLRVKYAVLAALLLSAWFAPGLAGRLVEIEPFKTSITLWFDRSWPFVAYAIGLLLLNVFLYKAFCRYLCPLGAGLAIAGRLRLWNWIPRRTECGSRCQLCRRACEYDAIRADGSIDYDECFQCLDCVGIYHDRDRCAPLLLQDRKGVVLVEMAGRGSIRAGA